MSKEGMPRASSSLGGQRPASPVFRPQITSLALSLPKLLLSPEPPSRVVGKSRLSHQTSTTAQREARSQHRKRNRIQHTLMSQPSKGIGTDRTRSDVRVPALSSSSGRLPNSPADRSPHSASPYPTTQSERAAVRGPKQPAASRSNPASAASDSSGPMSTASAPASTTSNSAIHHQATLLQLSHASNGVRGDLAAAVSAINEISNWIRGHSTTASDNDASYMATSVLQLLQAMANSPWAAVVPITDSDTVHPDFNQCVANIIGAEQEKPNEANNEEDASSESSAATLRFPTQPVPFPVDASGDTHMTDTSAAPTQEGPPPTARLPKKKGKAPINSGRPWAEMIRRPVPPPPVRSGRAGPTPPAVAKRGNTYANVAKAAAAPVKGGNNNQGGTVIALARALPALNPQRVAQVAAQVDGRRKRRRKAPEFTTAGKSRRQIIATWPAGATVPALDMQEMYRLSNQHLRENRFAATSILSVERVTSGYALHTAGSRR
ncbi:hypothetical protein BJ165DRAFT_1520653 [Panaeolus papilionaceus]|nr:hypothetical protein BJ165DRAFT_1520653 [Panaeolus papilionaceus]